MPSPTHPHNNSLIGQRLSVTKIPRSLSTTYDVCSIIMEGGKERVEVHFKLAKSGDSEGENAELFETKSCNVMDSVLQLKESFVTKVNNAIEKISLSFQGETLSNLTTLRELGADSVTLVLHVADSAPSPTPSSAPSSPHRQCNLIRTTVPLGDGNTKNITVKIERSEVKKPFLGGYRHQHSGLEYHNASAQTLPKPHPPRQVDFYERDCQTIKTRNVYQQVNVDAATQMNKNGCFIDKRTDKKLAITGVYETADEYCERILQKVIVLQSYWRRWLAMCFVRDLRRDKERRAKWEAEQLALRQKEREEHARKEFHRRMNPRTKDDFDLLYHALEMWRQEEIVYINETSSGAERKAALCCLLEQEAQLIASIGRHKIIADEENQNSEAKRFLNKAAAPTRWTAFDGKVTQMNTPYTLRAEQLRDIYSTLAMPNLSQDERLDVLLTLKSTVKEHDCKLTRDIVELIDREADLLVRGVSDESLRGLRKRISSLFMQYCRTPLFNPEAAKLIKVPKDPATLCTNVYYCRSCGQYLPSTDFELSANSRVVGHCRACRDLDNQARAREDWTTYRVMLKGIRQAEETYHDQSHIVFIVQEADLRYLVENIWGGQSALSACKDLFELRLVRWNHTHPWAPWNCLLLTREEASCHDKLEDLNAAYGAHFVQKVQHKHILAQNYFSHIPAMAEEIKGKIKTLPLPQPKEKEFIVIMKSPGGTKGTSAKSKKSKRKISPSST